MDNVFYGGHSDTTGPTSMGRNGARAALPHAEHWTQRNQENNGIALRLRNLKFREKKEKFQHKSRVVPHSITVPANNIRCAKVCTELDWARIELEIPWDD